MDATKNQNRAAAMFSVAMLFSAAADVRRATAIEIGRINLPSAITTSSILMTESMSDCASACKLDL
jgi:hypothetical protein